MKSWKKIATVNNRTTSFTHRSSTASPLKAGKKYTYTVRAYNGTFKKWGGYNTKGVIVTVPKKPVAKPTVAPTAAPKPTEAPNPTNSPENPTVTPQPTKIPEPTQTPTATPTATPRPTEPAGNEKAEEYTKEVIRLTNIERKKEGLSELKYHAKLQQAAMVRAKELVQKYSHTRPDGRNCDTAVFEAGAANPIAENAGAGRTTPQGIVDAWMNSAGHKTSIMDPHSTHIGAGYYCDSDGTGYWIQVFAKDPDAKCTLTVDGNGGTFPSKGDVESFEMVYPQGMTVHISDIPEPQKDGFIVQKWVDQYDCRLVNFCMDNNYTIRPIWIEDTTKSQSLLISGSAFISEDLFTDGNTDKETETTTSDISLDNGKEDIIETNDISDSNDITFADNDSTDTP